MFMILLATFANRELIDKVKEEMVLLNIMKPNKSRVRSLQRDHRLVGPR